MEQDAQRGIYLHKNFFSSYYKPNILLGPGHTIIRFRSWKNSEFQLVVLKFLQA